MKNNTNEKGKTKLHKKTKVLKNSRYKWIIISIIVIIIIVTILYFISGQDKEVTESNSVTDNLTIDYNLLDVERSNGNIVMENESYAEVIAGVKRNTSQKLKEEKTYNNYIFRDASIEASGGISQFIANIENIYTEDRDVEQIYVVFIDIEGNEIARIETYIPDMEANEISQIYASTEIDITNAYDFYLESK